VKRTAKKAAKRGQKKAGVSRTSSVSIQGQSMENLFENARNRFSGEFEVLIFEKEASKIGFETPSRETRSQRPDRADDTGQSDSRSGRVGQRDGVCERLRVNKDEERRMNWEKESQLENQSFFNRAE
jgi:hypothetical protein